MPSAPAVEPPGVQAVERRDDLFLLAHRRGRQHLPGRARVHHDGHGVGGLQTTQQQLHGLLDQRQLVGVLHRAADVDQHHEVRVRPLARRQLVALDADVNQLAALAPGRVADDHRGLERLLARIRRGPGVVEVVDHLLDAHRILLRQHAAGRAACARSCTRRCRHPPRTSTPARLDPGRLIEFMLEMLELVAAFDFGRWRRRRRHVMLARIGARAPARASRVPCSCEARRGAFEMDASSSPSLAHDPRADRIDHANRLALHIQGRLQRAATARHHDFASTSHSRGAGDAGGRGTPAPRVEYFAASAVAAATSPHGVCLRPRCEIASAPARQPRPARPTMRSVAFARHRRGIRRLCGRRGAARIAHRASRGSVAAGIAAAGSSSATSGCSCSVFQTTADSDQHADAGRATQQHSP